MRKFEELKRFDLRTRNKLRAIFSENEASAIRRLAKLRGKMGKNEAAALEALLIGGSLTKATRFSTPFPKSSQFSDKLQTHRARGLDAPHYTQIVTRDVLQKVVYGQ